MLDLATDGRRIQMPALAVVADRSLDLRLGGLAPLPYWEAEALREREVRTRRGAVTSMLRRSVAQAVDAADASLLSHGLDACDAPATTELASRALRSSAPVRDAHDGRHARVRSSPTTTRRRRIQDLITLGLRLGDLENSSSCHQCATPPSSRELTRHPGQRSSLLQEGSLRRDPQRGQGTCAYFLISVPIPAHVSRPR